MADITHRERSRRRGWRLLALAALLLATGSAAGCGADAAERADGDAIDIVVTTGMIADVVRRVVGDHAQVTALMGSGVDPHLYNPTRSDVLRLDAADVVFYNGVLLEGRMTDVLGRLHDAGRPVYALAEMIDEDFLLAPEEFEGAHDPHVWMDVSAWAETVEIVAEAMAAFDPDHADDYRAGAAAYRAELDELDAYVREVIDSIPEVHRVLVTAHDAFNYFGRAYGIEVRGVYGISTESEAGMRDLHRLVDYVIDRQVPAVFVETTVSDRAILSVIAGATHRGHDVAIGGSLFSDAMGESGTYEGTYIGMIDHNATTIALALGGDAPPEGLRGRLTQVDPLRPADEIEGLDEVELEFPE